MDILTKKLLQINLTKVAATGKNGRILKEDVLKYLESLNLGKTDVSVKADKTADRIEPFKGFQKAMFKSMTESLVGHQKKINISKCPSSIIFLSVSRKYRTSCIAMKFQLLNYRNYGKR